LGAAASISALSIQDQKERPVHNSVTKRILKKRHDVFHDEQAWRPSPAQETPVKGGHYGSLSLTQQRRRKREGMGGITYRNRSNRSASVLQGSGVSDDELASTDGHTSDDEQHSQLMHTPRFPHQMYGTLVHPDANMYSSHHPPAQNGPAIHELPFVLGGYVQLLLNVFLTAVCGYIVYQFVLTIHHDVNIKVDEYSSDILQEMSVCTKNYIENRCSPDTRVPAMETACLNWESCMNRDPKVVGRAKVSAETFAEIINGFIDPISYKTMAFFAVLLFGSVLLSHFAFNFMRHRNQKPAPVPTLTSHHPAPSVAPPYYAAPVTPYHHHHLAHYPSVFPPPSTVRRQRSTRFRPKFGQESSQS
ncbi:hypothetical protein IWQ62_005659, partial [Dispira parvispora]